MDNEKKVKMTAMRIAFLMEHQEITDVVEMESVALVPVLPNEGELPVINTESPEYLAGASDAFISLITFLKQKGGR